VENWSEPRIEFEKHLSLKVNTSPSLSAYSSLRISERHAPLPFLFLIDSMRIPIDSVAALAFLFCSLTHWEFSLTLNETHWVAIETTDPLGALWTASQWTLQSYWIESNRIESNRIKSNRIESIRIESAFCTKQRATHAWRKWIGSHESNLSNELNERTTCRKQIGSHGTNR